MQKTILVLGATGMLGQPVSHALKDAGYKVRLVTRDAEKARQLFDGSFEITAGDLSDAGFLERALDGCYGAHISLPAAVEQGTAETVAKTAARHGLQRITYISGASVGEENRWFPMVDHKFLAETALRQGEVPCTILCPTWVMESLPLFVNQGQAAVIGKQPHPYHWVAAVDIARMVAAAYRLGEEADGRFIVHGPQAVLMQEALSRYCAVFHPEIKKVSNMPIWLMRLMALFSKDQQLKGAVEMMAYFEKVGEGSRAPQAGCVLGTPQTSLERWFELRKNGTARACPEPLEGDAFNE